MSFRITRALLPLLLLVSIAGAAFAQAPIANIAITEFAFSPNGDGIQDVTRVKVDVTESATVDVLILRMDSTTVVDSLVTGVVTDTSAAADWDGLQFNGSAAPEDSFLVMVRASGSSGTATAYRTIMLDVTAPQVIVTNLAPFVFGPGSPDPQSLELTIDYDIIDPSPSVTNTVIVTVLEPDGTPLAPNLTAGNLDVNMSYTALWDGTNATGDGVHQIQISADDQAGNSAVVTTPVSVDLDNPRIRVTDPLLANDTFATPPDSVRGWTWDRNGIQAPVLVSYAGDNGFFGPIATTRTVVDTVFFAIPFADSINGDGTYTLVFRADDVVGRTQDFQFVINVDNLAPSPPILNARGGITNNPKLRLFPTLDADVTLVNFYVNDIFDTSAQAVSLPYEITLSPGVTRVKATAEDQAGNVSGFSNEITVEFDAPEQGVVIPQPFEPDDVFIINLKKAAATTTLNIYDLKGNLVETLHHNQLTKNVRLPWDGINGAGVPARRGPLVAVFQLVFEDGSKHVTREIFVFRQR